MQFLVTGCSTGLGLELAHAILKAGHKVIASSRNPTKTPDAVKAIEKLGGAWIALDVAAADVNTPIQNAIEKYGPIDVLINNAGYADGGVLETYSLTSAQNLLNTNLLGAIQTIQATLPSMRHRASGTIVNISSAEFWAPHPCISVYAATKFALEGLSEALSAEVSPFNIRILLVEPGGMRTDFVNPDKVSVPEIPEGYKGTTAEFVIGHFAAMHGMQGLDPRKTAEAIVEEVVRSSQEPPLLRLPLGGESLGNMRAKVRELERTAGAFEEVALRADS